MVAWTGHVGHVGCYGLDLPHELISNSGIVLQQCHLTVKYDAKDVPGETSMFNFPPLTEIQPN